MLFKGCHGSLQFSVSDSLKRLGSTDYQGRRQEEGDAGGRVRERGGELGKREEERREGRGSIPAYTPYTSEYPIIGI